MSNCIPCIFFDSEDHIWNFNVNSTGRLVYSIMYEENKWTKVSKIDDEVIDFTADIDDEGKVFIIYSVKGGQLKYCTWKDGKWFGKTLYDLESMGYQIKEINVKKIMGNLHIFFIARNNSHKSKGALMHLCLDGEKNISEAIYDISLMQETYCHYQIETLHNERLQLFLVSGEENEISLKAAEYKNGKWSNPKRIYGINGNKINFSTLQYKNKINILNFSKENSIYSLEHVLIENDGRMKSSTIYEGALEIYDYFIFEKNGMLFSMWAEGSEVFYSSYDGQWSEPFQYEIDSNELFSIYKFLSSNSKYEDINAKNILGTMPPEVKLLLPGDKSNSYKTYIDENSEEIMKEPLEADIQQNDEASANELLFLRRTIRNLEKKIINLQIQLQQKQRIVEESDGNFLRLTAEKKKSEDKLNIISEIQQTSAKELELTKNQLLESNNMVNELKNKLQEVTLENEQLKGDLEAERNKGFVDRILKKRVEK